MRQRIVDGLGVTRGNPLRPFVVGYLWFNLLALLAGAVTAALGLEWVYTFLALMWPLGMPLVLGVIWLVNRPYARDLNELRAGHAIVSWEPSSDEWIRFEQAEWERAKRDARLAPSFGLILAIFLGAFTFAYTADVLVAAVAAGLGLLIGFVVAGTAYLFGKRRFGRRDTRSGDVRFSERGVLQPSGYLPYRGFNIIPLEITLEAGDPASLYFRVGSVTEQLTTRVQAFRVPVPAGREDEAADLAARLMSAGRPSSSVTATHRRPNQVTNVATVRSIPGHRES